MYIPEYFKESNKERILQFANEHAFATVISNNDEAPFASHLPLLIEDNKKTIILGHMAKANPQWQHFSNGNEVLIIFQGPHSYISPNNYEDTGVPTWNYTAVHMYGEC